MSSMERSVNAHTNDWELFICFYERGVVLSCACLSFVLWEEVSSTT